MAWRTNMVGLEACCLCSFGEGGEVETRSLAFLEGKEKGNRSTPVSTGLFISVMPSIGDTIN